MRNHLCCSALVLLTVLGCGGTAAVRCRLGERCACPRCPAGQEPSKACGQPRAPEEEVVQCQSCPPGTFSASRGSERCRAHTACEELGREMDAPGSPASDAVCGGCLPGSQPPAAGETGASHTCLRGGPDAPPPLPPRVVRTAGRAPVDAPPLPAANVTAARGGAAEEQEEETAEYAVFALVPVFCVTGLLGILVCNVLKKKGYRCSEREGHEELAGPLKEGNGCPYIPDDPNEDTISALVRLISEKKENAAALEELLLEYESKELAMNKSSIKFPMLSPLAQFRSLPRLCPHQSHLHTISGLSGLAPRHALRCSRCAQRKWPAVLIPPLDALRDPLKPLDALRDPLKPLDALWNPLKPQDALRDPLKPLDTLRDPLKPLDALRDPLKPLDALQDPLKPLDALWNPLKPQDALRDPLKPLDTLRDPLKPLDALRDPLKPAPMQVPPPGGAAGLIALPPPRCPPQGEEGRDAPVPKQGEGGKRRPEGLLKVLSVGRFQVAQIPEQIPVATETGMPCQEPRNSVLWGGEALFITAPRR